MLYIWSNTLVVKTEYIKLILAVVDPGFWGGGANPKGKGVNLFILAIFLENCMKFFLKNGIGRGGHPSLAPPLDPPMQTDTSMGSVSNAIHYCE